MIDAELFINGKSSGVSQLEKDGCVYFDLNIDQPLYASDAIVKIHFDKPFLLHRYNPGRVVYPGQRLKFECMINAD